MKTKLASLFLAALTLGIASALAGPGPEFWLRINQTEQFAKFKAGDKIAYVCNQCKTVSEVTIESPEKAMELCKEGAVITCPSCKMKVKVTLKGGRNDLPVQREITYVNDKGEDCLFIAKVSDKK